MSENLIALLCVVWYGQLIFGPTDAAPVVFLSACPYAQTASKTETMKVSLLSTFFLDQKFFSGKECFEL